MLAATSFVGLLGFSWPFVAPGVAGSHGVDAPWLFIALIPLLFAVVLAELGEHALDAKAVAVLGVLAGVGGTDLIREGIGDARSVAGPAHGARHAGR